MTDSSNKLNFDTSNWYAVIQGWLIVPFAIALFDLVGAIIMVLFATPSQFSGNDILFYYGDFIRLPFVVIAMSLLFTRHRFYPVTMMVYFFVNIILVVVFYMYDLPLDTLRLIMSAGLIVYFSRSKRVKATFGKNNGQRN